MICVGLITFHPFSEPGDDNYGLLYIGSADGGSGGDPLNLSLDLSSNFGKILRIDPLGSDSDNGQYGIPDNRVAVTGVHVFRSDIILQLRNRVLFGDMVNGELLHFNADNIPEGGTEGIRRMLLRDSDGEIKTFLEVIQQKNREQGRSPASRTDLRFGTGPDDQFFLLNKQDGTVRLLIAE